MLRPILSILLVLLALASTSCASTRPASSTGVERELREITGATIHALLRGDAAFFDRLLAEDYIGTSADGRVIDKAVFMSTFQPPPSSMNPQFEVVDVKVRVNGDTAILNARRNFRGEMNGQEVAQSERTTQVFRRAGGTWRLLAEHSSPVGPVNP